MSRKTTSSGGDDNHHAADGKARDNANEANDKVTNAQENSAKRRLDPAAEERIGRKLKAMYDHVASEPVPDHLLDLLAKLDDDRSEKG